MTRLFFVIFPPLLTDLRLAREVHHNVSGKAAEAAQGATRVAGGRCHQTHPRPSQPRVQEPQQTAQGQGRVGQVTATVVVFFLQFAGPASDRLLNNSLSVANANIVSEQPTKLHRCLILST